MQACGIPFFMNTGDSTTQSSGYSIADMHPNMEIVLETLNPIPKNSVMLTVGNHDSATGNIEINGEKVYYRYQLNNQDRTDVYFGWQRANKDKKFDQDGSYYCFDDPVTKTRYIMFNSFWYDFEGEEDGFVTDVEHSFFHTPILGQKQLYWFAHVALNMPRGYSAVIGTHNAFSPRNKEILRDIIAAYMNRTTCDSSYTGNQEWQSSHISADYSAATGEIIAIFLGHNYKDDVNTTDYAVPCITITTAGADVRDEAPVKRVPDTDTEPLLML